MSHATAQRTSKNHHSLCSVVSLLLSELFITIRNENRQKIIIIGKYSSTNNQRGEYYSNECSMLHHQLCQTILEWNLIKMNALLTVNTESNCEIPQVSLDSAVTDKFSRTLKSMLMGLHCTVQVFASHNMLPAPSTDLDQANASAETSLQSYASRVPTGEEEATSSTASQSKCGDSLWLRFARWN